MAISKTEEQTKYKTGVKVWNNWQADFPARPERTF